MRWAQHSPVSVGEGVHVGFGPGVLVGFGCHVGFGVPASHTHAASETQFTCFDGTLTGQYTLNM